MNKFIVSGKDVGPSNAFEHEGAFERPSNALELPTPPIPGVEGLSAQNSHREHVSADKTVTGSMTVSTRQSLGT